MNINNEYYGINVELIDDNYDCYSTDTEFNKEIEDIYDIDLSQSLDPSTYTTEYYTEYSTVHSPEYSTDHSPTYSPEYFNDHSPTYSSDHSPDHSSIQSPIQTNVKPTISNWKEHIIETYLYTSRDINIIPDRLYQEYESVIDFITNILDINYDAAIISYVYFTILTDYDNKRIPDNFDDLNEYVLSLTDFSKECQPVNGFN